MKGRPRHTIDDFLRLFRVNEKGCWIWQGRVTKKGGYGLFGITLEQGLRFSKAHRFAFYYFRGPIPPGKQLDHVECDTPPCVNPWHVEPSTNKENVLRGRGPTAVNSRKERCKNGHLYNKITQDGRRYCSCRNKPGKPQ